jgi:hypothetical protein
VTGVFGSHSRIGFERIVHFRLRVSKACDTMLKAALHYFWSKLMDNNAIALEAERKRREV